MVSSSTLVSAPDLRPPSASAADPRLSHPGPGRDESAWQDGGMDVGDRATLRFEVTEHDTAMSLGSGDLPVLGTPRLLAWCEAATCAAVERSLGPGRSSVGTRVRVDHVGASPVGARVEVVASVVHVDGRLVRFEVAAEHTVAGGTTKAVAHGEITRVVVDRERFLSRLG
jgi:fluoroacetyl-CoA thioesterase